MTRVLSDEIRAVDAPIVGAVDSQQLSIAKRCTSCGCPKFSAPASCSLCSLFAAVVSAESKISFEGTGCRNFFRSRTHHQGIVDAPAPFPQLNWMQLVACAVKPLLKARGSCGVCGTVKDVNLNRSRSRTRKGDLRLRIASRCRQRGRSICREC